MLLAVGTPAGTRPGTSTQAPNAFVASLARTPPMPHVARFAFAAVSALRSIADVSGTGTTTAFAVVGQVGASTFAAQGLGGAFSVPASTPGASPLLPQAAVGNASPDALRTTGTHEAKAALARLAASSAAGEATLGPSVTITAGRAVTPRAPPAVAGFGPSTARTPARCGISRVDARRTTVISNVYRSLELELQLQTPVQLCVLA